ncbi:MAG: hypothetical protein R3D33_08610 [Hyphomicrobiaceae bacterium]
MYERFERNARVLIYSHDSFGLGHLSRCRAIAHSLVDHRPDISVLILSGLPIIGSYPFRPRVDFVRFPGVVKLKNGSYTARGLDVSIEDAIELRQSIIRCAAETFRPDVFLVDKEPLGLRGEVGIDAQDAEIPGHPAGARSQGHHGRSRHPEERMGPQGRGAGTRRPL